jgi:hypothetical protein
MTEEKIKYLKATPLDVIHQYREFHYRKIVRVMKGYSRG